MMNCPSCGAEVKGGARFCANCGTTMPASSGTDDVAKTMVATPMPSIPAPQQTQQQPSYSQPQQSYQQPYQDQSYQQPYQQQPQYQQPDPYQQQQYQQQPYQQAGYGPSYSTPYSQPGTQAGAGKIGAILMLVCSLAMVVAIFLPIFSDGGSSLSTFDFLIDFGDAMDSPQDNVRAAAVYVLILGITMILSFVTALFAFLRRKVLSGIFGIILGLIGSALAGLLWAGISESAASGELGLGLPLMTVGGLGLFVFSIVYLVTRRRRA